MISDQTFTALLSYEIALATLVLGGCVAAAVVGIRSGKRAARIAAKHAAEDARKMEIRDAKELAEINALERFVFDLTGGAGAPKPVTTRTTSTVVAVER